MSFPGLPAQRRRNDSTSSSASMQGMNPTASPHVVSYPQQEKLIHDIQECIADMKSDYDDNRIPINDDNQQLHRFCAKLEHLLRTHMKDKYTVLGKKKDYWDYFCDCLGSTKGLNDGIKYVKTVGEYKTSVGKGRAFLRFSLMHNRMADSIQACVMNGKVTSDWFNQKSIWLQHEKSSALISTLYDLSDLQFDLAPRGYDLDNAWPSFARKNLGTSLNWNPPSRADSMSSLNSIPVQDTSHNRFGLSSTPSDPVDMGENLRSDLMDQIDALEQQKKTFQQSVLTTQGELDTVKGQQAELKTQYDTLVVSQKDLQQRYDRMKLEVEAKEKEWAMKENMHQKQLENTEEELSKYKSQATSLETKLSTEESSRKDSDSTNMSKIVELEKSKVELQLQVRTLTQDLSSSIDSESKKSEAVQSMEERNMMLERKNQELLQKMENVLVSKNDEAYSQINSTSKLQDALVKLKDAESALLKKEVECEEVTKTLSKQNAEYESLKRKYSDVEVERDQEVKKRLTDVENLKTEMSQHQAENDKVVSMLKSEIEAKEKLEKSTDEEMDLMKKEICAFEEDKNRQIKEIEGLNEQMRTTNEELRTSKDTFNEKISGLQKDLNEQLNMTEQANVSLDQSKKALEFSQNENERIKSELDEKKSEMKKLVADVKNVEKEKQELETKLMSVEKEIANLSEQQKLERGSADDVQRVLQEKMEQIRNLEVDREVVLKGLQWINSNMDSESIAQMPKCENNPDFAAVMENIKDGINDKQNKIRTLSEEQKSLRDLTESMKTDLNEKGRELLSAQEKIKSSKVAFEDLEVRNADLEAKHIDLEKLSEKSTKDNELLKQTLGDKEKEVSQMTSEVERLKVELNQLHEMFVRKSDEFTAIIEKKSQMEEKLQQKSQSFEEATEMRNSLQEKVKEHEQAMSQKCAEISELETSLKNAQSEEASTKKESEELRQKIETITRENQDLQGNLGQSSKVKNGLEEKLRKEREEKTTLEEKRKELQASHFDLEQKLGSVKEDRKKQKQILDQVEKERTDLMTSLEDALNDLGSIKEQLNQTSSELEKAYSEKEKVESERDELMLSVSEKDRNVKNLEESCEKFKTEVLVLKTSETDLENKCQNLYSENEKLSEEIVAQRNEIDSVKSEFENLQLEKKSETDSLSTISKELQEKIDMLTVENNELKESCVRVDQEKSEISEEKASVQTKLDNMEKELSEKSAALDDLEKSKMDISSELSDLTEKLREKESELTKVEESHGVELDMLKQQVSALEFQLSSEQIQYEQTLQNYNSQDTNLSDMKDKLVEQEILIENLEREMNDIKTARDQEKSQQYKQLEELRSSLELSKEEKLSLNEQLSEERKALENEKLLVVSLQTKLKENEEVMEKSESSSDSKITELKSDNDQLKKKLIKLIREKDSLWQMTDNLAYQQKVKATEKWIDEKEVTNCMGCNAVFTFTIRKHHCRLCGKVFCYNCSNNFVMTAHSSKKSRACNFCHRRLMEIDELNSSLIDKNSDDEIEQSMELPHMMCRQSSQAKGSPGSEKTVENSPDTSSIKSESTESTASGGAVAMVPGQVAADINISMVGENETDEVKEVKKQGTGNQVMNVLKGLVTMVTSEVEQPRSESDEAAGERKPSKTDVFHVISDDEIEKSLTQSAESQPNTDPNLSSSLTISAEELQKGQINSSNEVWIKAGKKFAVPVLIDQVNTTFCWEFTSQPKDIVFSVSYKDNSKASSIGEQTLVPSCKCDSHKQAVKGELTAKQVGIYTLLFDNSYSRLTSKKIGYSLWIRTPES